MVRDTLYSERGNDHKIMRTLSCHCVCTLFVHAGECCWWEATGSCASQQQLLVADSVSSGRETHIT